jgi:hypothetical protein
VTTTFYLGTHLPSWLATAGVRLFVSHRRLAGRRQMPRAIAPWALDSGGFTELSMYGGWQTSPRDYVAAVRRYRDEIGLMDWAAPQDWMCEPIMLQRTGLSVLEHQERTVANFLELRGLAPDLPFVPVLQGWTLDDYLRHVEMYDCAGVDLRAERRVGLGTVCRRQATHEISVLVRTLARFGMRLHGFGVKASGFAGCAEHLASCDSLAWSYDARRSTPLPGCTHKNCANCMRYALLWRERMVGRLARVQLALPMEAA